MGAFSTVWLCWDTKDRRFVAVKILKSATDVTEASSEEIKLLLWSRLSENDKNGTRQRVLQSYDESIIEGPFGQHICIAKELLDCDLLKLIRNSNLKGFGLKQVRTITWQILEGSTHLHDNCEILHTDLKPENVLVAMTLKKVGRFTLEIEINGEIKELLETVVEQLKECFHFCGMSAEEYVGKSRYTHEWLALTLAESSETFADYRKKSEIQTVDVKEISGKNGFCSKIYLCTVRFTDGNHFEAILKVPELLDMVDVLANSNEEEKSIDEECMALMHKRECRFMSEFAPKVNFPVPEIYECVSWTSHKDPGAILMQSFYGQVALVDLVEGFSKSQLIAIAKDLARFQAYFLKLEDKSWVEKCKRSMHPQVQGIYVSLIEKLKETEPETFASAVDTVLPYVKNPDFIQYTFYTAYESHILPAVFVHGDVWVNNVLWKKNPDGTPSNEVAAYIDWQLSHSGCLTADLASALVICCDADVRRRYTDEILTVYYETLKEEVGDLPFSFDHVKKLFEANFAAQTFTLMICMAHLPVMNAELPKNVQEAQYEKFKVRVKLAVDDMLEIGFPKQFDSAQ